MKRILITGKNGYISRTLKKRLVGAEDILQVDMISLRDESWKSHDFGIYDSIVHAAALVHSKNESFDAFKSVNTDLTKEVAEKAKAAGVKQFIFFSTMGVYGKEVGKIDIKSKVNPKTSYAKSKLVAEKILENMNSEKFKVVILRPPLVYGKDCPGNYNKLSNLASKIIVFPKVNNRRSMIYIDNLNEFIRKIIEVEASGTFFPQNSSYVNTTNLMREIAHYNDHMLIMTSIFNPIIKLGMKYLAPFRKVFGSLIYDQSMPGFNGANINGQSINYEVVSFEESIKITEDANKVIRSEV